MLAYGITWIKNPNSSNPKKYHFFSLNFQLKIWNREDIDDDAVAWQKEILANLRN